MKRVWRGRCRDRIWKCLIALDGIASSGAMVRYCWPRRSRFSSWHYAKVRRFAAEVADRVGHVHRGRNSSEAGGWLWKLRE
jgi:hypothetical protein